MTIKSVSYDILLIQRGYYEKFLQAEASIPDVLAKFSEPELSSASDEDKNPAPELLSITDEGVAVISISGMLTNRHSWVNKYLGLVAYERIAQAIMYGIEQSAKAFVFYFDTPGGKANGMAEVADLISNIPVKTWSYAGGSMCSAGYFLGCQSDYVFTDLMALVGSIGVVIEFYDYSKFLKENKITPVRFRSGDLKGAGSKNFSLSKREREHIQNIVMTMAENFYTTVEDARGIDRSVMEARDILSGKEFVGAQAVQALLVDGVKPYGEVLLQATTEAEKHLTNDANMLYG
jgi:ClpP class serine protease